MKVPPTMSMGELLFYVAEKRSLNPTDFEFGENYSGKKAAKMFGTIGESGYKELYLVPSSKLKKKGMFGFGSLSRSEGRAVVSAASFIVSEPKPVDEAMEKKLGVSGPVPPRGSIDLNPNLQLHAETQRVTSLLAEGISLSDSRIPDHWRMLFDKADLTENVGRDFAQRRLIMDIIERSGGPLKLLPLPEMELESLFSPALNYRHSNKSVHSPELERRATSRQASISKHDDAEDRCS